MESFLLLGGLLFVNIFMLAMIRNVFKEEKNE